MDREHIKSGLRLKLVRDYLTVPAGTWATVDTVHTPINGGAWCFTVRWFPYTPLARGPVRQSSKLRSAASPRSLNLWESDLQLFAPVTAEDEQAARKLVTEPPLPLLSGPKQLALPFPPDTA